MPQNGGCKDFIYVINEDKPVFIPPLKGTICLFRLMQRFVDQLDGFGQVVKIPIDSIRVLDVVDQIDLEPPVLKFVGKLRDRAPTSTHIAQRLNTQCDFKLVHGLYPLSLELDA